MSLDIFFRNGKCEDELDFDKPVEEHLSKDVRNMVGLMQEFWYALPVGMQTCILTNARDGFFEDLQTCVNKKGLKEYKTKKFGPFPMPDAKLFSKDLLPKL